MAFAYKLIETVEVEKALTEFSQKGWELVTAHRVDRHASAPVWACLLKQEIIVVPSDAHV